MMTRMFCLCAALTLVIPAAADDRIDFNRDIRPILSDNCFFCHGPDDEERQAELRLDTRDGLTAERDGHAAIVPGRPGESELVRRISSPDEFERMPPAGSGKALTKAQIELIRRWIEQGAEWEEHWAYVPPKRPAVPEVKASTWPLNPIDRFILARLEREEIAPSPQADPRTLVRRLAFDLTGLPPAPEEVEAFVGQVSNLPEPDGQVGNLPHVEMLADRLLASPHFGERMTVYWLDLVRYADTVGYHGDQEHHISPYRDYVIKSFNDNLPFDRFTIEQLAGDLLPEPTEWQKIATGYNRVLQTSHEGGVQAKEYLAKYSADRVRNASAVWMGATMGCAECHDHKYDPITAKDFYSFAAFFADIDELQTFKGGDTSPTKRYPEMPAWNLSQYARIQQIEASLPELKAALTAGDSGVADRIQALEEEKAAIEKQFQPTMITVSVEPRTIRVLPRGNWLDDTGEIVEPAVPAFLPQIEKHGRATRLDLAQWFAARENPLTARVFVNRLWKLFFGEGLSGSLDDVGAQGEPPMHPELLDWLAVEFIESGWDVKHMVRLMVTSRVYRQSSLPRPELAERDPDNRLLARQSRWRLDAEFVRDNALAVSGLLVKELGGRSVRPYQPAGYYRHLNFPKREYKPDIDEQQYRRGLYMHWQRVFLHPMLKAFDAPTREECTAERPASNTPLAALVLLNDPSFLEAARGFAVRVLREGGNTTGERIAWAWRESLGREPDERELATIRALYEQDLAEYEIDAEAARELLSIGLADVPEDIEPAELAAWTSVARAILNLNEVITRN